MGKAALIVFLGSLGMGLLCLVLLARSVLLLYRTLESAYDDYRVWIAAFAEDGARLGQGLQGLESRVGRIAETGNGVRETVEDIMDAMEDLRSSPLLRAARFLGSMRGGPSGTLRTPK